MADSNSFISILYIRLSFGNLDTLILHLHFLFELLEVLKVRFAYRKQLQRMLGNFMLPQALVDLSSLLLASFLNTFMPFP